MRSIAASAWKPLPMPAPRSARSLERADRFLGLAALVSVVLAAIAVAMAARRHSARHLDACAVLRCLGASQRTILAIQLGELVLIGLAGCAVGVLGGLAVQSFVASYLADVIGMNIPGAGWRPALHGFAVGFTVLLAFAAPPVLALRRVPALRVLRRDLGEVEPSAVAASLAGLSGLTALLWWKAGSVELGLTMLGGIAGTFVVLALIAYGLVLLLRRVRTRLRGPLRYGLANVSRRAAVSVAQIAALGLGLMAILLLTLVRRRPARALAGIDAGRCAESFHHQRAAGPGRRRDAPSRRQRRGRCRSCIR
jgi:putative ABC transport system permease protein